MHNHPQNSVEIVVLNSQKLKMTYHEQKTKSGRCRTKKCRTRSQDCKLQDHKNDVPPRLQTSIELSELSKLKRNTIGKTTPASRHAFERYDNGAYSRSRSGLGAYTEAFQFTSDDNSDDDDDVDSTPSATATASVTAAAATE